MASFLQLSRFLQPNVTENDSETSDTQESTNQAENTCNVESWV